MSRIEVSGPLDVYKGKYEKAAEVLEMFSDRTGPLAQGEWQQVLDSRRVLIAAELGSIFQQKLGNVKHSGYGTLFGDKPEVGDNVLDRRGVFFREAAAHRENPERTIFVGIDSEGKWILVSVQTKCLEKPHLRIIATKAWVRNCSVQIILKMGIDPLNLFRWMNYWVESVRNNRYSLLMRAIQLEALFTAQDLVVSARTSFKEYCEHRLAEVPEA